MTGYVVSYDAKRGVGFIRAAQDDAYDPVQLSKDVKERAKQAELLLFRDDGVATEVPLLEGLKVRFEMGEPETDEKSVWQVACDIELVADEPTATGDEGVDGATASAAPPVGQVDAAAAGDDVDGSSVDVRQVETRDVGFGAKYEEGWDAASWGDESWS